VYRNIIVTLLIFVSLASYSQIGDIKLGIILGNPTGITAQYRTGSRTAVNASLGRQIAASNYLLLSADFLVHLWSFDSEGDQIRVYAGGGMSMGFLSDLSISFRIPVGAGYYFSTLPLEMFAEIVPTLQVFGEGNFRFWPGGYLGVRWIFPKK
jgi:hypothetical protein